MFRWLRSLLEEIVFFFATMDIRENYWANPKKLGYLIEENNDGDIYYHIESNDGRALIVEMEDIRNYIIRRMKQAGVPIIPYDIIRDVQRGKRRYEDVIKEYSQKSPQK